MRYENFRFFQHEKCEYFPCHNIHDKDNFSCLFCYCPLSPYKECGGKYMMLKNGWKDCSKCLIPHYYYDFIVEKLITLYNDNKKGDININENQN